MSAPAAESTPAPGPRWPAMVGVGLAAAVLPPVYLVFQFMPWHFLLRHWSLPAVLAVVGWLCLRDGSLLAGRVLLVSAVTLPLGYVGLGVILLAVERLLI